MIKTIDSTHLVALLLLLESGDRILLQQLHLNEYFILFRAALKVDQLGVVLKLDDQKSYIEMKQTLAPSYLNITWISCVDHRNVGQECAQVRNCTKRLFQTMEE